MNQLSPIATSILRAAYQVSGCTGSSVAVSDIANVIAAPTDELSGAIATLQSAGLLGLSGDLLALTSTGLKQAASLPPVSEPPLFQDI